MLAVIRTVHCCKIARVFAPFPCQLGGSPRALTRPSPLVLISGEALDVFQVLRDSCESNLQTPLLPLHFENTRYPGYPGIGYVSPA